MTFPGIYDQKRSSRDQSRIKDGIEKSRTGPGIFKAPTRPDWWFVVKIWKTKALSFSCSIEKSIDQNLNLWIKIWNFWTSNILEISVEFSKMSLEWNFFVTCDMGFYVYLSKLSASKLTDIISISELSVFVTPSLMQIAIVKVGSPEVLPVGGGKPGEICDWKTFISFISTLFHAFSKSTLGRVNFNFAPDRVKFKIDTTTFPITFSSWCIAILMSHPSISDNILIWPFLTIWPGQTCCEITCFEFGIIRNWTKIMFVLIDTVDWVCWWVAKTKFSWIGTRSLI